MSVRNIIPQEGVPRRGVDHHRVGALLAALAAFVGYRMDEKATQTNVSALLRQHPGAVSR